MRGAPLTYDEPDARARRARSRFAGSSGRPCTSRKTPAPTAARKAVGMRNCTHPVIQYDEREEPYCGACGAMLGHRSASDIGIAET
ncbi:MAG: hypothetical protein U5K70_04450 [Halodesulfurarchaeum sp.]|nr:hypothetical protein [Halodesulfurarchaeum sp.]